MRRYLLEVWSRTNATRLARAVAPLALVRSRTLQAEETLEAALPTDDPAVAQLVDGAVLHLHPAGDPTDDLSLWRLTAPVTRAGEDGSRQSSLRADALWLDFRHGMLRQKQADGSVLTEFGLVGLTPTQWLEDVILPAYDGDAITFQLGVVEPVDPLDLDFQRTTPLEAVRMLEAKIPGGAEAQFRLDASGTFYHVDLLTRVGNASGGAELRHGKNITGAELVVDESEIVTRLYAFGADGLSLADASWAIGAVAGTAGARVLTIEDGDVLVPEDGVLVGLWFQVAGKGAYPIDASDASDGTITVDDTALPALVAGDVGVIAEDAAGTRAAWLESASGRAAYGVRVGAVDYPDIPNVRNLVANADLSAWNAGLPTNWSKVGGAEVVAESADPLYAKQGGKAAHVTAAAAGQGLISDPFGVPQGDARRPYLGISCGVTVKTGRVRLELRHSNGNTYPLEQQQGSEGLDVYLTLAAVPVHAEPLPAGTAQLALVAHGDAAEFYMDCALASPITGSEIGEFIPGDGAKYLWEDTAAELERLAAPKREYRIDVVDLHKADREAFPFDRLDLGDDVRIVHPDLGSVTQRVVELSEDLLNAAVTRVVLAASAADRVANVWRPSLRRMGKRPNLGRPATGKPEVLRVTHTFDRDTGQLSISALGNASIATLELRTKAAATDPWPGVATDTANDRQAAFDAIAVAQGDSVFYQVIGYDAAGNPTDPVESSYTRDGMAFAIGNLRVIAEDADSYTYEWERVLGADETWAGYKVFDLPLPDDAWAQVKALVAPVGAGGQGTSLEVPKPADGQETLVQFEARGPNVQPGWVRRISIPSSGLQPPVPYTDDSEGGTTGTQFVGFVERGIPIASVEAQTQVGIGPWSGWLPMERDAGDASTVRGGTLGALEFEQDVDLDQTRFAWIGIRALDANGTVLWQGLFGFDRNRMPDFISDPVVDGTVIDVVGDSGDTKSIRFTHGAWVVARNGSRATVDVAGLADDGVTDGIQTNDLWPVLIELCSDPKGDIDGTTLIRPLVVEVEGGGGSAANKVAHVSAEEPGNGSQVIPITVRATAATGELHVKERHKLTGGAWSTEADITAQLGVSTPITPPTTNTAYNWSSGFVQAAKANDFPIIEFEIRATIEDGAGNESSSRTADELVSYYVGAEV